jgi:hypothetical protein
MQTKVSTKGQVVFLALFAASWVSEMVIRLMPTSKPVVLS